MGFGTRQVAWSTNLAMNCATSQFSNPTFIFLLAQWKRLLVPRFEQQCIMSKSFHLLNSHLYSLLQQLESWMGRVWLMSRTSNCGLILSKDQLSHKRTATIKWSCFGIEFIQSNWISNVCRSKKEPSIGKRTQLSVLL